MPPKKKFSKEQIIETAFEIAKHEGIDAITIRKVAENLGSSIAPIYVNFADAEELIREVMKRIVLLSQQMIAEQNTGNPFHDIGIASLRFAKEYSVLFRDLTMKQHQYLDTYDEDMGPILIDQMKQDPHLADFTEEELLSIFLKMRIFTLGLATMVANRLLPESFGDEQVLQLLDQTAIDVIYATQQRGLGNID